VAGFEEERDSYVKGALAVDPTAAAAADYCYRGPCTGGGIGEIVSSSACTRVHRDDAMIVTTMLLRCCGGWGDRMWHRVEF